MFFSFKNFILGEVGGIRIPNVKIVKKRMYSSRMRTVSCSGRLPGGCLPGGVCPGGCLGPTQGVFARGCLPGGCLPGGGYLSMH